MMDHGKTSLSKDTYTKYSDAFFESFGRWGWGGNFLVSNFIQKPGKAKTPVIQSDTNLG